MKDYRIIYKILVLLNKYKGDESFSVEFISAEGMKVEYNTWEQLLIMLQEEGLITGVLYAQTMSEQFPHLTAEIHPRITLKGIEFLESNSMIQKAKEALKMVGEII